MKRLIALLALFPLCATAGGLQVDFSAPTLFTDGTVIDKTKMSFALHGAIEGQVPGEVGTSTTTTIAVASLPSGKWCGQVYVIVDGSYSDAAPVPAFCVTITITDTPAPKRKPNPAYNVKPKVLP